jgi:hypothetical protein
MNKYIIAFAQNVEDLAIAVNKLIEEGYEPLGGICVETFTEKYVYMGHENIDKGQRYYQTMFLRSIKRATRSL